MQEKFSLFEINIQHQQKGYDYFPITVEFITPGNEVATKRLGKLLLNDKIVQDLREYEDWGEPEKYGRSLGELIFREAIRDALNQAGTQLRVFLSVDAPELRGLRWERLATPAENKWQMLARNENTPFAISLASQRYVSFPPLQPKEIKALVVVAHPNDIEAHGFSSFDANKAIKDSIVALSKITAEIDVLAIDAQTSINEALGEIDQQLRETEESTARQIAVKQIGEPTEASLSSALTTKQYSILHLVAHGNFVAQQGQEETYVYLGNESNETVAVSATKIISLLHDKQNLPRFAFLVSCDSGRQRRLIQTSANSAGEGLGQRLVQEAGLHAVVAMMDEITITTAEQLAPTFYERLSEHGYPDLALVQAGAALRNRRDMTEIVPVLFSRLRGRPLYYQPFTEAAGIPLTETEIEAGYEQLHQLIRERAPRVLKDFTEKDSDGKRDSDALFQLKQAFRSAKPNWSELTNLVSDWSVIEWLNNLCYNLLDFDFVELAKGREVPNYAVECPFPGLKAFGIPTQDDREGRKIRPYFFGRDKQIDVILKKIKKNPVLLVTGASGSGKSSIVMAGVIPQLENEGLKWEYMTPGDNPTSVLQRKLDSNPDILVVDQLEEIFTHVYQDKQGKNTREQFIENLANWLEEKAQNRKLLLTMRSDFESDCSSIEKLADWVRDYSQTVLPLTSVELQDVVLQQAANAFPTKNEYSGETVPLGLKFDPGLLNTIMSDLHGETGVMPLLQFTLHALWERRQGRWLRANAYAELGGIEQAIAHTAEEIYQNLNNEEQSLMKYIFIRLTHLDESGGRGEQRRDTRHRVALKDLVPKGKMPEQVADLVFDESMRGLLVTSQPETVETKEVSHTSFDEQHIQEYTVAKYTQVEVIHEAVIRHWQRLQDWLDSDYEMLRQRQKIQQEALDWHNADVEKQNSLLLLQGWRLQEFKVWRDNQELEFNESEEQYIQACDEKERKQQQREIEQQKTLTDIQRKRAEDAEKSSVRLRRRRNFALFLAFAAILLAGWAWIERERGNEAAMREIDQANMVQSQALAVAAESVSTNNPLLAVQLSLEAAYSAPTPLSIEKINEYAPRLIRPQLVKQYDSEILGAMWKADGTQFLIWDQNGVQVWDEKNSQLVNTYFLSHASLSEAAWNSDGDRILTYGGDAAKVWDGKSGEPLLNLAHQAINGGIWNEEGSRILTFGGGIVKIWDLNSNLPLLTINHNSIEGAEWSYGLFLTWSSDRVRVWDGQSEQPIATLETLEISPVFDASWYSNMGKILVRGQDLVMLWDAWDVSEIPLQILNHDSVKGTLAERGTVATWDNSVVKIWNGLDATLISSFRHNFFSPGEIYGVNWYNGNFLTLGYDGAVKVWQVDYDDKFTNLGFTIQRNPIDGMLSPVESAKFINDGKNLLTYGKNGIEIWEDLNQPPILILAHNTDIRNMVLSRDETRLLTWDADNIVRLWSIPQTTKYLLSNGSWLDYTILSKNGDSILEWGRNSINIGLWKWDNGLNIDNLYLFDLYVGTNCPDNPSQKILSADGDISNNAIGSSDTLSQFFLLNHFDNINGAIWNGDETRVLTWSNDGTAKVWNAQNGEPLFTLEHEGWPGVCSASWNDDESRILTWSTNGLATVWNGQNGDLLFPLEHEKSSDIHGALWNSDESRILTWSSDGSAKVWNGQNGDLLFPLEHGGNSEIYDASWNDDETSILTWSTSSIKLWNSIDGKSIFSLTQGAQGIAWNHEDKQILTWNGTIARVLSALDGEEIGQFEAGAHIESGIWSKDYSQIMLAASDRKVYRYWVDWEHLFDAACMRVPHNMSYDDWLFYFSEKPYSCTCSSLPPHPTVLEAVSLGKINIAEDTICGSIESNAE